MSGMQKVRVYFERCQVMTTHTRACRQWPGRYSVWQCCFWNRPSPYNALLELEYLALLRGVSAAAV